MTISEHDIVLLAKRIGLADESSLSIRERELISTAIEYGSEPTKSAVDTAREAILRGEDPLGDLFCLARDAATRRPDGAVYTPPVIVDPMVEWVLAKQPSRVVDAGSGSGRYASAVARRDPSISVIAVDLDPLATLMTRAALAVVGAANVSVVNGDYTKLRLKKISGTTAFIGNPPYVRHHQIPTKTKAWARLAAAANGVAISGLAGLHAHFYLATASHGRPGDFGCFVTSSEWLDVNYGSVIRDLLVSRLGGQELHLIEPEAMPFEGTSTTAAIVQFEFQAERQSMGFRSLASVDDLAPLRATANPVAYPRLRESNRWSVFMRTRTSVPDDHIELGELVRVHRGAVTGANATWVTRDPGDLPADVLYRSVTRARELFSSEGALRTSEHLKFVIDLPTDLDELPSAERGTVERFLRKARSADVHTGYVAKNRRAWWSVGLRAPAPVLATYMARRPPAFVRNVVGARHINIAHGLYPRETLTSVQLDNLAAALSSSVQLTQGRTYAGGLTKFEPKEMERLTIPNLAMLSIHGSGSTEMDPR